MSSSVPKTGPAGATVGAKNETVRTESTKTDGTRTEAVRTGPAATASALSEPARGGAGFGSLLAASLLGGVVGAGLLYGVQTYGPASGLLPKPAESGATLDQRLAGLATRDSVQALDQRLAAAEGTLRPLPEAVRNAEAAAKSASAQAAEAAKQGQSGSPAPAVSAPAGSGEPATQAAAPAPDLGPLQARLDGLDQRLSDLQKNQGGDPALRQKIDDLARSLQDLQGKADTGELRGRLDGLDAGLKALQADLGQARGAGQEESKALSGKLDALQQEVQARGKADDQRLADLARDLKGRADAGSLQAGLRAVAADRIGTALATGAPYADALAALKQLSPDDAASLAPLDRFAAKGAPTAAALADTFRPIGNRLVAEARARQQREMATTGSITDRLASMAGSIVSVRKADGPSGAGAASPAGDPTEAAVAKLQSALDRGAIAEAASAFDALPEAARQNAAEFGDTLKARAAAGEAARARLAATFGALSGASR